MGLIIMETESPTPLLSSGVLPSLVRFFERQGLDTASAEIASVFLAGVGIAILAFLANLVAKRIIVRLVTKLVRRTPWSWDDKLADNHVFTRLSHLAPAMVINIFGRGVFGAYETLVNNAVLIYIIVIMFLVMSAALNAVQAIIGETKRGADIPIKGFVQAIKLVAFLIGGILVLSVLVGKTPIFFLSGIGALTAVLLLIFRDALLGLVAGVMISVNQMVRVGDWIEMPSNGADGDVIDVSLTTVKVRNWDRTITTVPSYDLISKSFKNWRAMFENQGRRIKRSIYIDMQTIDFVDEARMERFKRIRLIQEYLAAKVREVEAANKETGLDLEILCNGRRLTNIGTFRAYCLAYLKAHPGILQRELMIVRQLAPTEHGLPLEIYAFTNDTRWVFYEGIQSDIFDHLLSIMREFGLRVFQGPSGYDVRETLRGLEPKTHEALAASENLRH